jgi:hypothetical protein
MRKVSNWPAIGLRSPMSFLRYKFAPTFQHSHLASTPRPASGTSARS